MSDTRGLSAGTKGCTPSFTCCSVRIDAHTLESAVDALLTRPDPREGRSVHLCNAYTLSLARRDLELRRRLNQGSLNLPDGMPLIWVGRRLGLDYLEGRVYGPDLMIAAMDRGREIGLRHYLHGSTDAVLMELEAELLRRLPGVHIVGRDAPPFREPTADEQSALEQRLVNLGPDIVWVGLGTPKQDAFVHHFRHRVPSTFVGVGAAFDFISGAKRQAPVWMQKRGLEWAYRLAREPRRLGRRYLIGNARFVTGIVCERPKVEVP
ncbi:MAG: WecB/TagA/CpsF family glycosyltransferase [Actinomycetota bacterium]|nr:WecB/TagA/CpsF family glycosyltransferase [Actinomycetota bacterium]